MDKTRFVPISSTSFNKFLLMYPERQCFYVTFFQLSGSFVVVDASEKDKVLESGGKVACIVSQVLFFEQVRALRKSPEWCVFSSYLKMSWHEQNAVMCHYLTTFFLHMPPFKMQL